MQLRIIKSDYKFEMLKMFFETLSYDHSKEEIKSYFLESDLSCIESLIQRYTHPIFSHYVIISHLINLIAQVDKGRAMTLILQLSNIENLGLTGLYLRGFPLKFKNKKVYIEHCDIDMLCIHYDSFSAFRHKFIISNTLIEYLEISFYLANWQSEESIREQVMDTLKEQRIGVSNLEIKFI